MGSTQDKMDAVSEQGIQGLETVVGDYSKKRQTSGGMVSTSAYSTDYLPKMSEKFENITGKKWESILKDHVTGGKGLLEQKREQWDNYLANMSSGLRTFSGLGGAGRTGDEAYDMWGGHFESFRGGQYS